MNTQHQNQVLAFLKAIYESQQRIEEKLKQISPAKPAWLDYTDVSNLLHATKGTLDNYRKKGLLPYSKIGGKVFFRQIDIENYLTTHLVRKEERL